MDPQEKAKAIKEILGQKVASEPTRVRDLLAKARELKGLSLEDTAVLLNVEDDSLLEEMLHAAREVKETIYGNRMVIFAPLYVSNECANGCLYCAFRHDNKTIRRATLNQAEIAEEIRILLQTGQKRVLLVAWEHPTRCSID